MKKIKWKYSLIFLMFISVCIWTKPYDVTGEVKPIEEANEQLQGISEEEQETLEELFILTQEIEEMEREEARIVEEINHIIVEIDELDRYIIKEEEDYSRNLKIMEQVLISYQRGGPASYLDILLKADNLTSFIKSLNLIKDISRNTGALLASIEESKLVLEEKKQSLADSIKLLQAKREELQKPISKRKALVEEQKDYLDSLSEKRVLYEQYLDNVKLMWDNLKDLFSEIVDEFARIINEGHFTTEDLNLQFNFLSLKGSIHEDTFNRIMNDNSNLSRMLFSFEQDLVRIEVPDNNLVIEGHFELSGSSSLLYVPERATFYDMALETESIDELFRNGPLIIDFEQVAGSMITIDIELKDVQTADGFILFSVGLGSLF